MEEQKRAEFEKWLGLRMAESRAKRKREEALLQEIMADEARKTEELRVREKLAQQKRDRRLEKYHQEQSRLFGLGIEPRPRSSGQIQGSRSMSGSTLRPQSAPTPAELQRTAPDRRPPSGGQVPSRPSTSGSSSRPQSVPTATETEDRTAHLHRLQSTAIDRRPHSSSGVRRPQHAAPARAHGTGG